MKKVAVLVDGGFYRKIAKHLWGEKTPEDRTAELIRYCHFHLKNRDSYIKKDGKKIYQYNDLYRIFYYDCAPIDKTIYNPLTQKNMRQKGVDMKIGLDIASLAYKKLVDQIVLISGDSDFVPAAKLARIEGIDFIVDSLGTKINENLTEHIDGLRSYYKMTFSKNDEDDLCEQS